MVFLGASAKSNASSAANARAAAVVKNLSLEPQESAEFGDLAKRFRVAFFNSKNTAWPDEVTFRLARSSRIASFVSELNTRFSIAGQTRVRAKIQDPKRQMKLFPIPNMNGNKLGILEKLFSLPKVYAQIMSPYGSAWSDLSYDDSTSTFHGVGITNGDSGCNCHQSQVNSSLYDPSWVSLVII